MNEFDGEGIGRVDVVCIIAVVFILLINPVQVQL